jgi:hypothetical protein
MAGDSWTIPFSVTDINGNPLDLTQASFQWTLLGPNGLPIQGLTPNIAASSPMTAGQGVIELDNEATALLPPGRYSDAMRIEIAGNLASVWTGYFLVDANAFAP